MKSQRTAMHTPKNDAPSTQTEEPKPTSTIGTIPAEDQGYRNGTPPPYTTDREGTINRPPTVEHRLAGTAGLAVVLAQLVAYFSRRADVDDLDVLSFALHHLFCRVDFLYQKALPDLREFTIPIHTPQTPIDTEDMMRRQNIWMQLQTINRALDRMEPLCHLLSDATECILDSFDEANEADYATEPLHEKTDDPTSQAEQDQQADPLLAIDAVRWEEGLSAIIQNLQRWQKSYSKSDTLQFAIQFARLQPAVSGLKELDTAFATILDSASRIFGTILPGFRTLPVGDDTATAALLFDLMQQSDRLLVQLEATLEPLNALIKHFSVGALM